MIEKCSGKDILSVEIACFDKGRSSLYSPDRATGAAPGRICFSWSCTSGGDASSGSEPALEFCAPAGSIYDLFRRHCDSWTTCAAKHNKSLNGKAGGEVSIVRY